MFIKGRAANIIELLNNEDFKKWKNQFEMNPLIIAGDFNSPSHLDWIPETKYCFKNNFLGYFM